MRAKHMIFGTRWFTRSFCLVNLVALLFTCSIVHASLNPIIVKGNAFFDSVTNERFYIRGVDYQVAPSTSESLMCSLEALLLLIMTL